MEAYWFFFFLRFTEFERDLWFLWLTNLSAKWKQLPHLFLTQFNAQSLGKFRSHNKTRDKNNPVTDATTVRVWWIYDWFAHSDPAFPLSSGLECRPEVMGGPGSMSWGDKHEDHSLLGNDGGVKRETTGVFMTPLSCHESWTAIPRVLVGKLYKPPTYLSSCELGILLFAQEVIPKWYQIILIVPKRLVNCSQAIYWEFKVHIYPPLIVKNILFIYLAALGLSCSTWDLLLWPVNAYLLTCGI